MIVVGGDVQVSPVIISHKGLTITTVTPKPIPNFRTPEVKETNWAAVDPENRGGTRLNDLMNAMEQLQVDGKDRIAIIKEIHSMGKLHAELIIK